MGRKSKAPEMKAIKKSISFEPDVNRRIEKETKYKRSKFVNAALRCYMDNEKSNTEAVGESHEVKDLKVEWTGATPDFFGKPVKDEFR